MITFSFPPAGGVGVLRALSFAKYLPLNGIRVDVLTARNAPSVGKDVSLLKQVPAEVMVHRSWTLDLPFSMRKGIKKLVTRRQQGPSMPGASATGKPFARENLLKRLLGNLLLPDPQVGWLPFAFPAAKRIIRSRKIDAVLITVPPFSTVGLIPRLRRAFPKLPLVVDFRDEWLATTIHLVSLNANERARQVATRTEREAVRDATLVVAVTEAARQALMERYPEQDPTKFRCIPNGFEPKPIPSSRSSSPARGDGRVVLTYLGSIYRSTDPTTFVEAVLRLPPALREHLCVRFIGHIETAAYRECLLRLGSTVELKGFVPQGEALKALDATDYLLLITQDPINVSAKFYDYLSGTKPILAAVHRDGEVRRLLEETRAGRWADVHDSSAILALLEDVLKADGAGDTLQRDAGRIAQYQRSVLASRYAVLLEGVVHAGANRVRQER